MKKSKFLNDLDFVSKWYNEQQKIGCGNGRSADIAKICKTVGLRDYAVDDEFNTRVCRVVWSYTDASNILHLLALIEHCWEYFSEHEAELLK